MSEAAGEGRQTVLVTGGTGFVGRSVVAALRDRHEVRVLARRADASTVDRVVVGDVTDAASLTTAFAGVDTIVHLVGIIEESRGRTFDAVIHQGTRSVVTAARAAGVERLIFVSAIGAQDDPRYPYHQAKYRAETVVRGSGLATAIVRPSVIFGKGDGFISVLAGVVRRFPITPVVGDGSARFHPIQVDDVAAAIARLVDDPALTDGSTYELGGGKIYTYAQMLDAIARQLNVRRPRVHVPIGLMKLVVAASAPLPKALRPPVTSEQLKMLTLDNTTANSATALLTGREPVALEDGIAYL